MTLFRQIKKFFTISRQNQWLFIEALFLTGVVRLAILVFPFRWLAPILGSQMQESPLQEDAVKLEYAKQIGYIVEAISRYTPWKSKCLVQAAVSKLMLRHRGIANTLYLGVSKDAREGLVAHAWLRCGPVIISGGGYVQKKFTVVGRFVDDGGCV